MPDSPRDALGELSLKPSSPLQSSLGTAQSTQPNAGALGEVQVQTLQSESLGTSSHCGLRTSWKLQIPVVLLQGCCHGDGEGAEGRLGEIQCVPCRHPPTPDRPHSCVSAQLHTLSRACPVLGFPEREAGAQRPWTSFCPSAHSLPLPWHTGGPQPFPGVSSGLFWATLRSGVDQTQCLLSVHPQAEEDRAKRPLPPSGTGARENQKGWTAVVRVWPRGQR